MHGSGAFAPAGGGAVGAVETHPGSDIACVRLRCGRFLRHLEVSADTNLARSWLYDQYEQSCAAVGTSAVNISLFGRILRIVFPSIQARRLGVRGQSRYFYHGVGVRANSSLANSSDLPTQLRYDNSYRCGRGWLLGC